MRNDFVKLYISNFLTGLVFWYGIEKLFMYSIGIDAVGVGVATMVFIVFTLLFDIPTGVIADRWSRKGMLVVSVTSLGIASVILGLSNSLLTYSIGYLFYGLYAIATNGTLSALIYDTLHERGETELFSKVLGRSSAIFLLGAAVANLLSGFIANMFGYRFGFIITVIPCLMSALIILSIHEPKFHKSDNRGRVLNHLTASIKNITKTRILLSLSIVLSIFAIVEIFKAEFGQLYMFRYFSLPQTIGILWAIYAVAWSAGSVIAHRVSDKLNLLIAMSILPLVFMSVLDVNFSLVLFMIQAVASGAMINRIETVIQDNTPSAIRASTMSVVTSVGRAILIPSSLLIGWIILRFDVLWALRFVTGLALMAGLFWFVMTWLKKSSATSVF